MRLFRKIINEGHDSWGNISFRGLSQWYVYPRTHITSDMCIPSNMAASDMCIPYLPPLQTDTNKLKAPNSFDKY